MARTLTGELRGRGAGSRRIRLKRVSTLKNRNGRVAQTGAPAAVYDHPASPWVARVLGQSNLLEGMVRKRLADHEGGTRAPEALLEPILAWLKDNRLNAE